jgi:hypothetical protein
MKLRLLILLAAAALAAAPAAGQTVKSLGYNTTNGQIVYSGSNSLTFTNALQFSTNAQAATRTNLGGTTVGNSVFTATNAAAAADAIGLGSTNEVIFGRAQIGAASFSTSSISGVDFAITAGRALTFISGGSPDTSRTNLGLGATNAVTFSNITATGTLGVSNTATFSTNVTVSGNATLNGSDNLMPNATTASSASSLMTRGLSDARYTTSVWLTQISDNQTITNGGFQLLGPSRINSFSIGYGASVPSGFTQFRVVLGFGWLQNPATNSTNFPVFVQFENKVAASSTTVEAEHGAAFSRTGLYPTNAASTGLAGTLTRRGVFNTTNTAYSFISDWVTIPSAWQSNAASNGFYHVIGAAIANNTGGSVTDGFIANHSAVGLIEFRK